MQVARLHHVVDPMTGHALLQQLASLDQSVLTSRTAIDHLLRIPALHDSKLHTKAPEANGGMCRPAVGSGRVSGEVVIRPHVRRNCGETPEVARSRRKRVNRRAANASSGGFAASIAANASTAGFGGARLTTLRRRRGR